MAAFGHMARSDQGSTIMQTEPLTAVISKKPQAAKGREAQRVQRRTRASVATEIPPLVVVSEFLTTKQAAEFLNLSRQFLEAARYRGDGSGPPYIKLQRAVRYRKSFTQPRPVCVVLADPAAIVATGVRLHQCPSDLLT
jgi:hypothetical protein